MHGPACTVWANLTPFSLKWGPSTEDASGAGVLIGLGSNAVDGYHDYSPDAIAGARMESGLDNSPMYDCGKVSLVFSIPIQAA